MKMAQSVRYSYEVEKGSVKRPMHKVSSGMACLEKEYFKLTAIPLTGLHLCAARRMILKVLQPKASALTGADFTLLNFAKNSANAIADVLVLHEF